MRRPLRLLLALGLLASLLVAVVPGQLPLTGEDRQPRILLSCLGVAGAAFLADLLLGAWPRQRLRVVPGLAAVVISQASAWLILWGKLVTSPSLWRTWWVSTVIATGLTALVVLRRALPSPGSTRRVTETLLWLSTALVTALAASPELPPHPPPWYWTALLVCLAGSLVGALLVWRRWHHSGGWSTPVSPWRKVAWLVASLILAFLAGVYTGRISVTPMTRLDRLPSVLAHLPLDEVHRQTETDLRRLQHIAAAVDDLRERASSCQAEIRAAQAREDRDHYTPQEEDRIRWLFVSYLAHREALLRLVVTHAGFQAVREPQARARSFLVGYGAGTILYANSLALVTEIATEDHVRRKLNEPEPRWGLTAGLFDEIKVSVSSPHHLERCEELACFMEEELPGWREAEIWPPEDLDWLVSRLRQAMTFIRGHHIGKRTAWLEQVVSRVRSDAYSPVYAVQSMVSEWIGDARLTSRAPFITLTQIRELQEELRPGDILLERRNWYLSNAFLPGFWPHAAIYVGSVDQLEELGVLGHPAVQAHRRALDQPLADQHRPTVIEAVSEGVILNSLEHSLHADYVAVLRPALPREEIAGAVADAFALLGRPYDFEFDFFTSDRLVCTEVVFRSYQGRLQLPLVEIMGRSTLPATEIVRRLPGSSQLQFVAFLDAVADEGRARRASEAELWATVDRPGAFNE